VFVDERRSAGRAPGPTDAAAAMVMANSLQQWDRSYDLKIRKREAQAGVNAMAVWKQHMLQQGKQGEGCGAPVDAEAGAAGGGEEAGPSGPVDWEEQSWEGDSETEEEEEDDDDISLELSE